MENINKIIVSGIFWQGVDRFATQVVQFIISIILARLIEPSEFGILAIMMVFISISEAFIDSGFSQALIQKKDSDDVDFSCVFFINICIALIFYVIIFLSSPYIASFYKNLNIKKYIRYLSIILVIRSFSIIQLTILKKKMQFKYNFKINFISIIVSGFLGIIAAYNNLGVWSLIIQQITKAIISGVMLWICIRWIPIMTFSFNSIRILFKYGVKIFLAGLFDTLYNNVYVIIIGKLYDLDTLAFYNRGNHLPQLGMNTVNSVFASVLFPAFSIIQDDKKQIYKLTKKFIKTSMFIILPILALMIIFADKIILILLGDKWLPSAIFLRLSCLIYLFWPLHTINLKILLACGRSDYFLLVEIIKKIQILLMIILTYRYGVLAMLWGSVVLAPISFIENSWANIKLIDYSPIEQIKDILPSVIITLIASIVVYYISPIFESTYILIFSSTILFIIIYLFLSAVFHVMPEAISHYLYKNF